MNVKTVLNLPNPEIRVLFCEQKKCANLSFILLYLSNDSIVIFLEDKDLEPLVVQRRWEAKNPVQGLKISRDEEIIVVTQESIIIMALGFVLKPKNSTDFQKAIAKADAEWRSGKMTIAMMPQKRMERNPNSAKIIESAPLISIHHFIYQNFSQSAHEKEPVLSSSPEGVSVSRVINDFKVQAVHLIEEKDVNFLVIQSCEFLVFFDLIQCKYLR